MKKTSVLVACAVATALTLSVLPSNIKVGPFGADVVSAASETSGTTTTTTTKTSTTKTSTSTSSSSVISGTMRLGSKGARVRALQTFLNNGGYSLKVDGDFGKLTLAAVKDFQGKNGLVVDGIVGPNTRAKINAIIAAPATPAPTTPAPTTPAPTTPVPTTPPVDVVTAASLTDNEAVFEKSISPAGKWIIATTKDLTFTKPIVIDGNFANGKTDATTGLKLIQRKIALYTQDDKRNVTARFTLTAPKITVLSNNASIEQGTVKGDIYVSAQNFQLKGATVQGNIFFTNKGAQETFKLNDSKVSGMQTVLYLPETVDAYASASKVLDSTAFEKAIGTADKGGKWIIAVLNNLKFDKELVLEGDFKNTKNPPAVARKLAIYAHDINDSKLTTGRFILQAPKLTIKSPEANITKGMFKGDVYVTVPNFKLVDAIVDGNIYFSTQEAMDSFKKLTDATSIVTGKMEVKAN